MIDMRHVFEHELNELPSFFSRHSDQSPPAMYTKNSRILPISTHTRVNSNIFFPE